MPTPEPKRASRWLFWGLLLAILAVVSLAYVLILGPAQTAVPAPPQPTAPALPAATTILRLTELEGSVEIRKAQGDWMPASQNAVLEALDAVRTGEGGRALLSAEDSYEVRLEPGTDVSVESLTESISQ